MKKLTQLLFNVVCIGTLVLGACGRKTTSKSTSESASEPTSESVSESESPSESESETHVHSWKTTWSSDGTNHWHDCEGCDEKKDVAAHVYDDDHDATCNVCGYTRSLGDHFPAVVLSHDGTHHWYACNHEGCDLKYEYVEHSYDDDHDTICDACGYVRELGDHGPETGWEHDETHHWHACQHAGCEIKYDYALHSFDDDHDATCDCGYTRELGDHGPETDWTHDEVGHWHACQHEGCEIKYDYAAHSFDDDHDATCNVCGYTRDLGDHTPKSAWLHDKLHHWHACNHPGCEYKFDYGEHHCRKTGTCEVCEINIADDFELDTSTEIVIINYGHLDAGTYFFRVSEFRNGYDYYLRFPYDALVKCHYYATEDATEFSTKSYNCSWAAGTTVQLPRSVSFHTTFVFEFTIDDVPSRSYDGIRIWIPGFGS